MRHIRFNIDAVHQHAAQRPPGYTEELLRCAIAHDAASITLDTHSACYIALVEKYREIPPRGLGDTVARAIHFATRGKVKPCPPCEARRQRLNERFPYGP